MAVSQFLLHLFKGVIMPPTDAVTRDDYDLQFGLNAVGHYYSTRLLIPELLATGSSRIVSVTSHGHTLVDGIKWETLRDGPERRKTKLFDLYNQSKRNCDQLGTKHVSLAQVDSGAFAQYDSTKGALTSLYAATSPQALNANGKYLIPWARVGKAHPPTHDVELGA
ncbi:NAD(P)-binding protein [Mycena sanguinolenta]|uniref:NAD(P)-binding protein n=1 Tax=Mycena sanguinolenta TaxID=230812 RepID=A0A8H6Y3Q2_9AGAR|nr:NAD(P)-binding protein [Mycena sanguinolenta]